MRASSAPRPVRLISPWTLVLSAVAVTGVLVLTYNSEDVFLPDKNRADDVSASYAEVLLVSRPEDSELRLDLIQLLIDLGQFDRARRHLLGWEQPDQKLMKYYRLKIDALAALHGSDAAELARVREQLTGFDHASLPVPLAHDWAELALRMQMPGLAADVYLALAAREPDQQLANLKMAARWYLASEQGGKAAMVYLDILAASDSLEDRRYYLRRAYDALMAVGGEDQASRLLVSEQELLRDSDEDAEWLQRAVQVAMRAQRMDLATALIDRWRKLQPYNPQPIEAQLRFQLASGNLRDAWRSGDLLLVLRPGDADLLKQMAQLGEWLGNSNQALDYWVDYLALREDSEAREHAWRLAFQLFDYQRGIDLLEPLARQQTLSTEKLDALVFAYSAIGRPEGAERWLRGYLERHPSHRLAWTRLLANLENTQKYAAQLEVWEAMDRRFELNIDERINWASAYWRLYQPEQALAVLDIDTSDVDNPRYWRTLAGLTWELERDKQLQSIYESMIARGITLDAGEQSQLVEFYLTSQPRRALELLLAAWRQRRDAAQLVQALDLAATLDDIELIRTLLAEASDYPEAATMPGVLLARARLAEHDQRPDLARRIYAGTLSQFPDNPLVRERMLWFLIEQRRSKELAMLLQRWRAEARSIASLWLPYAAASQQLGRHEEALAWYRLYLQSNPADRLIRAAYVDALEASGRVDLAQRLRYQLISHLQTTTAAALPSREAVDELFGEVSPLRYATWLRLLAASHSGRRTMQIALQWQDGSPAMLQLWFDRLMRQLDTINQESLKDAWVAWARSRGLEVDGYDTIQQALRNYNREMLAALVDRNVLDPALQVEALNRLGEESTALSVALSNMGQDQPTVVKEQLRRQAVSALERAQHGVQVGWSQQDFGGLKLTGSHLAMGGYIADSWYARLDMQNQRYRSDFLLGGVLGAENTGRLLLERNLANGSLQLTFDSSLRNDGDRHGFGISRQWQLTARNQLEAGFDWQRESRESGFMRALGLQDALWLAGRHGITARDQLSWSFARRAYATRYGDSLGSGTVINLQFSQIQQFEGPTWALRAGLDYQSNDLDRDNLPNLTVEDSGVLQFEQVTARTLLQESYGRLYLGSSMRRGLPGSLSRTQPDYTWLLDLQAGWDLQESQLTYGVSSGVGMRVSGNDELSLTFGYQSAPRGSNAEAGGSLELSYSRRLGR